MTTQTTTVAVTGMGVTAGVPATVVSTLAADDVCDRCGSRAYLLVLFDDGGQLTFCGHHGRAYRDALVESALVVHDETDRLRQEARR
ncbi:hypothetical protein [Catellatospora sp. NPDC049609]|uniref:DUF7455 domain-containing protein n=1 Tax=Catellatospora sp. NPDC049609 TaxID=3155505 RepID=UPI003424EE6F